MSLSQHSIVEYETLVTNLIAAHPDDEDLAMALAVGSVSHEMFAEQGAGHVAVLRHHGLRDGMSVYDLGCGSGRTAQALQRMGWKGDYKGADIIERLVTHLKSKCPDYVAVTHKDLSLDAPDESLDIVFHWSVFTHLLPEESYVYMRDIHRVLKPGGAQVFSFLEMVPHIAGIFFNNVEQFANKSPTAHLDTFLHRDWIDLWAAKLGFSTPSYTDGFDAQHHPAFGQSLVAMKKL